MKDIHCDVLVVGAGPAGSSAADIAAGMGVRVVIAERRPQIGFPVRCAEYIPAQLVGETNVGNAFIAQSVSAMKTFLPDGAVSKMRVPGFVIDRDKFDQALAHKARESGAKILLSVRVMHHHNGAVTIKDMRGECGDVYPKIIIGADGPHSRVGKWMNSPNRELLCAVQARVPLKSPLSDTEVYFDTAFYGGYGWLFPKGKTANVGLGLKKRGNGEPGMKVLLRRFIDRLAKEGKVVPRILNTFGGWIPAEAVRSVTRDNMLLAGDAAGQTHPITGGGIAPAVMCGKMAGKWAAMAVLKNDPAILAQYDREWTEMFGRTNSRGHKRRLQLEEQWDRLDSVIRKCWVGFRDYYDEP